MKTEPFVIERIFDAPVERVWRAVTDKEEMKQLYFDIEKFKPQVGFEFKFYGENEGRKYTHLCRITEVIVGKNLHTVGDTKVMKAILL